MELQSDCPVGVRTRISVNYHRMSNPAPISVPIGDGGNPSPSGEARFGVTWSRATLPTGRAHEERPEGSFGVDSEIP